MDGGLFHHVGYARANPSTQQVAAGAGGHQAASPLDPFLDPVPVEGCPQGRHVAAPQQQQLGPVQGSQELYRFMVEGDP